MEVYSYSKEYFRKKRESISTYIANTSGYISGIAFGKNIFNLAIIHGVANVKGFNYGSSTCLS